MESNEYIIGVAKKLVDLCETRDPFQIAAQIGVHVGFYELGKLKGMYCIIKRNRMMAINSEMDEYTQKLVCAHEIGHDILHRSVVKDALMREFELYHTKNRTEYEANIFAAELLISDDDIFDMLEREYDLNQMASALCLDMNLVAFKMENLRVQGYDLRQTEYRSDFLRKNTQSS